MHINIAPTRSSEEEVQLNNTKTRDANIQVDAQTFRGTTNSIAIHKGKYNITNLTYIDVQIDGLSRPVKVLHDSGAMISVIHLIEFLKRPVQIYHAMVKSIFAVSSANR